MKVETVGIELVVPYAKNPRKNAGAIAKVAASLREFGWRQPIVVDAEMVVVAGHTRLEAARSLGMTKVPVHVARELTATQARAYRLADNRVGQEAEWDFDLLGVELTDLKTDGYDLALTGFDPDELVGLLQPGGLVPGIDPDAAPEVPKTPITKLGDLIVMGKHRLLCGDATDATAWEKLLGGELADCVWTDPPYGVNYGEKNAMLNRVAGKGSRSGWSRIETPIEGDNMDEVALSELLVAAFGLAWTHSRAGASWYVAAPAVPLHHLFAQALKDLAVWRHTLQWVKNGMVLGRSDYHYRHEPIFYGWKEGAAHSWQGDRSQTTVLEFDKPRSNNLHPTMKPVALVEYCLRNSSRSGDLVVDPFAGSGSTLMASEISGRRARVLELSPGYCDVIVSRWETATGMKAVRPRRARAA